MRRAAYVDNAKRRMPAMRRGQKYPAACLLCDARKVNAIRFLETKRVKRSERPALGVADQKIPERLHARNRLQLFRIDEERVERRSLFFAEQLHEADVLLDQIVRQ